MVSRKLQECKVVVGSMRKHREMKGAMVWSSFGFFPSTSPEANLLFFIIFFFAFAPPSFFFWWGPFYCTFNEGGEKVAAKMQVDDGRDVGWPARVMGGSMQGRDVRLSSEVKNFCISTAFSLNEKMRSVMGAKPKG